MLSCRGRQRAAVPLIRSSCRYSSSNSGPSSAARTSRRDSPRLNHVLGRRAIVLRARDGIASPVDALAIIRTVERRFGRVAEFRFHRDADMGNRYQFMAYLSFWDLAAYDRVPKTSTPLCVKVPAGPDIMSGGPGLADITPFLEARDWADSDLTNEVDGDRCQQESPSDGSRVIQFQVDHYDGAFQTNKVDPPVYMARFRRALISHFVHWGGFATKKPLPIPVTITRSHRLFGDTEVDHPYMRYQLQEWGRLIKPFGFEKATPAEEKEEATNPATQNSIPETSENTQYTKDFREHPGLSRSPSTVLFSSPLDKHHLSSNSATQSSIPETSENTQHNLSSDTLDALPWLTNAPLATHAVETTGTAVPPSVNTYTHSTPSNTTVSSSLTTTPLQLQPAAQPAATNSLSIEAEATARPGKHAPLDTPRKPPAVTEQVRAARRLMRQVQPSVGSSKPNAKATALQQKQFTQPATSTKKTPKVTRKSAGSTSTTQALERPIEVEERTAGVAARLKGMLGGWL
ncbi:hypothetical protein GGX14DRAFT_452985 [Mycena pura]|uniref:Uncharacterized protein n=1 Tax=Mycena pura TaxID=153505 RepID=A0AAD6VDW7_9AGAR|nr:hypothetical protein GGX14DRAFT_452985 [Mycena pura]